MQCGAAAVMVDVTAPLSFAARVRHARDVVVFIIFYHLTRAFSGRRGWSWIGAALARAWVETFTSTTVKLSDHSTSHGRGVNAERVEHECYIDGSASVNPSSSGIGIWYGFGHRLNFASATTAKSTDNNVVELYALYAALMRHDTRSKLVIHSDSRVVCRTVEHIVKGELMASPSWLLLGVAYALSRREARTSVRKVRAHSGGNHTSNARADQLALVGAKRSDVEGETSGFMPHARRSLFHVDVARAFIEAFELGMESRGNGCIDGNGADPARAKSQKDIEDNVKKLAARAPLTRPKPWNDCMELTNVVALDCEMVGCGEAGMESMLAQVCVINEHGNVLYCSYSKAYRTVTDYRTHVSGILPRHVDADKCAAPDFADVQRAVANIIKDRVVVGHALENDFKALKLTHPRELVRDTAKWRPLLRPPRFLRPRRLRHLARDFCALRIQCDDAHDPAEDALAALAVYKRFQNNWEGQIQSAALGKAQARQDRIELD